MGRHNLETVGVRRTGWAALDRDPQKDMVEFICPHCGARDKKNARRERALIILRMASCRTCKVKSRNAMPASNTCASFQS